MTTEMQHMDTRAELEALWQALKAVAVACASPDPRGAIVQTVALTRSALAGGPSGDLGFEASAANRAWANHTLSIQIRRLEEVVEAMRGVPGQADRR